MRYALILALILSFVVSCGDEPRKKRKADDDHADAGELLDAVDQNNDENNGPGPDPNPAVCGNGILEGGEFCDPGVTSGPGVCPTSCDDGTACSVGRIAGDANACTARCVYDPITECKNGDGCCAAGCTWEHDIDCSETCGDGVLDDKETCDNAIASGAGSCPTSCQHVDACVSASLVGDPSNCTASCNFQTIDQCRNDDGCCPDGCNASNDNDCGPVCGNGILEPGELCDGNCPTSCDEDGGDACTVHRMSGSAQTCNVVCSTETITQCRNGDGCCPAGCNYENDADCDETCTPTTCSALGRQCGSANDGCGGTLQCGNCSSGQTCNGGTCESTGGGGGNGAVGSPCTSASDCSGGADAHCWEQAQFGFKDGYCTIKNCQDDGDCPSGNHCGTNGFCLKDCSSDSQCRSGYLCFDVDNDNDKECYSAGTGNGAIGAPCDGDWQCGGGEVGYCAMAWTDGYCTRTCTFGDCPTGSSCSLMHQACLKNCQSDIECRQDYACMPVDFFGGNSTCTYVPPQ